MLNMEICLQGLTQLSCRRPVLGGHMLDGCARVQDETAEHVLLGAVRSRQSSVDPGRNDGFRMDGKYALTRPAKHRRRIGVR